jgi:hypothetical protein
LITRIIFADEYRSLSYRLMTKMWWWKYYDILKFVLNFIKMNFLTLSLSLSLYIYIYIYTHTHKKQYSFKLINVFHVWLVSILR